MTKLNDITALLERCLRAEIKADNAEKVAAVLREKLKCALEQNLNAIRALGADLKRP